MPREPKPATPSEERQPALFTPEQLPALPALITAAKAYAHTGTTTCRDEERAREIAEAYFASGSLLATSKRFHCSPNTIKAVLDVLESAGKLDDLKQRVSRKLGVIVELTADRTIDALQAGTIQGNVLPIMLGVAIDKKALLDGDPTQRTEAVVTVTVAAQDVLAYLNAKGIAAPAIDVVSTVSPPEPQQTEVTP